MMTKYCQKQSDHPTILHALNDNREDEQNDADDERRNIEPTWWR